MKIYRILFMLSFVISYFNVIGQSKHLVAINEVDKKLVKILGVDSAYLYILYGDKDFKIGSLNKKTGKIDKFDLVPPEIYPLTFYSKFYSIVTNNYIYIISCSLKGFIRPFNYVISALVYEKKTLKKLAYNKTFEEIEIEMFGSLPWINAYKMNNDNVLITYFPSLKNRENVVIGTIILNQNLNKLKVKEYVLPFILKKTKFLVNENFLLTNTGELFSSFLLKGQSEEQIYLLKINVLNEKVSYNSYYSGNAEIYNPSVFELDSNTIYLTAIASKKKVTLFKHGL